MSRREDEVRKKIGTGQAVFLPSAMAGRTTHRHLRISKVDVSKPMKSMNFRTEMEHSKHTTPEEDCPYCALVSLNGKGVP